MNYCAKVLVMIIAIAVWGSRISPVFDVSKNIMFFDSIEEKSEEKKITAATLMERVLYLSELNVDVLICGAISHRLTDMIVNSKIRLIPFVSGEVENIYRQFLQGKIPSPEYTMPGCKCKFKRHRHRGNF